MAIQSKPYFWITCDRCQVSAQESSDYSAWADVDAAWDEAASSDWREIAVGFPADKRKAHLCDDCVLEVRASLGYDIGGEPYEDEDGPANHPVICMACKQDAEPDTTRLAELDDTIALTAICKACGFQTFTPKTPENATKSTEST